MNQRTVIETLNTLPSHYYFDPAHYQRELEALWYRQWICVGRFDDLNEPGDFRVIEVGDQSIFITRDGEGHIKAFYNTCRHRGSILCENESGRFSGGRIVCPYHAWTYSLEGQLVKTHGGCRPMILNLNAFPSIELAQSNGSVMCSSISMWSETRPSRTS